MPLHVYPPGKKSPNCRIRGTVRGIPYDASAGTSDLGRAQELAIRIQAELLDRSIHGPPPEARDEPTFADAVMTYLAADERSRGTRIALIPLTRHFGPRRLSAITQEALDAYASIRHPVGTKPATIARMTIGPMTAVLNHAGVAVKFRRPKIRNARLRYLTHDEADRLIAAAADHLKPLIVFLLHTGARMGEAIYLDWRNVDLTRRHVSFVDTKNGESRGVPLDIDAWEALANLPGNRKGPVFRKANGFGYAKHPKGGGGQIKTGWNAACRRAGIKDATPHTLRHTFASWAVMRGIPLLTVSKLLGHKTLQMTARYAHLDSAHLASAVQSLGGFSGGPAGKVENAS